ncbi:hypothetical protein ACN47E_005914 [Coniothyrium glycines]
MPRKATKSESASASRGSSKRPASETPSRHSKRARAIARKSYAETGTDSDDSMKDVRKPSPLEDDGDAVASDYEELSEKEVTSHSESDVSASEEEEARAKKSTPRGRTVNKSSDKEADLWRSGRKLAPGTQVIIKKPKARDAGETPYEDATIHPNTMLFLEDLAANNDRQWLKLHDPDYRASFQDFTTFTEQLSEKIMEADETIPELPVKDIIYRIYRDVRFSKDPTPYKTYFSAGWSRTGRKGPYAHYYVQIQPNGGSFVGGGYWQPDAAALSKLRRDIDRKPHKIKAVLTNAMVREAFLGNVADDAKKAVKAFVDLASNRSNALKRNPKDYTHDHRDIELLRLRNFTMGRRLTDDEITGPGVLDRITELIQNMVPFVSYLNSVCCPDEQVSSSSDAEDDASDDDDGSADSRTRSEGAVGI